MRTSETPTSYTGAERLSIIAGWTAEPRPCHRALEAVAAEMVDLDERDHAARVAYARRAAR